MWDGQVLLPLMGIYFRLRVHPVRTLAYVFFVSMASAIQLS